jgi:hypothetical protein
MYRPQFPYPDVELPCEAQRSMYSFDSTNTPVMTGTLASGATTGRIPLHLDVDAEFWLRAITTWGGVSLRLEDSDSNPLSDDGNAVESTNYQTPGQYSNSQGAGVVVMEAGDMGILGAAGGNICVFLYNGTSSSIDLTSCAINLHGIKIYSGVCK